LRKNGKIFDWYWNFHIYRTHWFGLGIGVDLSKYESFFDDWEGYSFDIEIHFLVWKIFLNVNKLEKRVMKNEDRRSKVSDFLSQNASTC